MKDVRLIQLVRGAEAGTDLSFIVEALNLVIPHTEVEGPLVARAPLILDPEFLARLHVGIGRSLGQHRSDWKACHWIHGKVKQLELILRVCVLNLKSRLHEV
jgi:hypothetical protein